MDGVGAVSVLRPDGRPKRPPLALGASIAHRGTRGGRQLATRDSGSNDTGHPTSMVAVRFILRRMRRPTRITATTNAMATRHARLTASAQCTAAVVRRRWLRVRPQPVCTCLRCGSRRGLRRAHGARSTMRQPRNTLYWSSIPNSSTSSSQRHSQRWQQRPTRII